MSTTFSDVELVSVAEIAAMLGVSRQYVDRLSRQDGFPEPLGEVAAGRIWKRDDVEKWARETGRMK